MSYSGYHGSQQPADGIHSIAAWWFANNTDRENFSPIYGEPFTAAQLTSDDLGKVAWVHSDDSIWLLKATTPTWVQISFSSADNQDVLVFGASRGNTATNIYLRYHQNVPTNVSPIVSPFDTTLIAISASGASAQTWQAQVHLSGSLVAGAYLDINASQNAFRNDLSIDFDAGDAIELFCSGTGIQFPTITAFFKKR